MTANPTTLAMTLSPQGEREIVITRAFGAPRELVFRAFTDPALVLRWMATPQFPITKCEIDLRVGGATRHEWRGPDGQGMGVSGEYREIEAPARTVHKEVFDEDWTGGEARVTTTFVEAQGLTTVTMTICYASTAARDAVLQSGMEQGLASNFDNLQALLSNWNEQGLSHCCPPFAVHLNHDTTRNSTRRAV